jgi:DNA-binding GntR family transcriptional regulator
MEINLKSLREQVYEYLKEQINKQNLKGGDYIDINALSNQLKISKTPLRDALLQLEMDGFVTIKPRKGILINKLNVSDIRYFYEIIGALECTIIQQLCPYIDNKLIEQLKNYNDLMQNALDESNFELYYKNNLNFHNSYLNLSKNHYALKIIENLRQRLYDFPRKPHYLPEWEKRSITEHDSFIELVEKDCFKAAIFMKDVHWSFSVQEKFIMEYYFK